MRGSLPCGLGVVTAICWLPSGGEPQLLWIRGSPEGWTEPAPLHFSPVHVVGNEELPLPLTLGDTAAPHHGTGLLVCLCRPSWARPAPLHREAVGAMLSPPSSHWAVPAGQAGALLLGG